MKRQVLFANPLVEGAKFTLIFEGKTLQEIEVSAQEWADNNGEDFIQVLTKDQARNYILAKTRSTLEEDPVYGPDILQVDWLDWEECYK